MVGQDDVDEALRLIEASKDSLAAHEGTGGRRAQNAQSRIYNLVKTLADSGACRPDDEDEDEDGTVELSMRKVRERVLAKGFTEDQWLSTLEEYTSLDVSLVSAMTPYLSRIPSRRITELTIFPHLGLANRWQWQPLGVCHVQ